MRPNGEQLKEMRDLEPKYFLLTQYLLVAEMLPSFLPTLKYKTFAKRQFVGKKLILKLALFLGVVMPSAVVVYACQSVITNLSTTMILLSSVSRMKYSPLARLSRKRTTVCPLMFFICFTVCPEEL